MRWCSSSQADPNSIVRGDDEVVLEFAGRSERDAQESRQIGLRSTAASLGHVGPNRNTATPHLRRQTVQVCPWEALSSEINGSTQVSRPLPYFEFPEVLHDSIMRGLGGGEVPVCRAEVP